MAMITTAKAIKDGYKKIVKLGYCELEEVLTWIDRNGLTRGVYGWNADVFTVNGNTAIVTGYRPFGKRPAPGEIERVKKSFDGYKERYIAGKITLEELQKIVYQLLGSIVTEG